MGFGVEYGVAPFGFVENPETAGDALPLHSARRITASGDYVVSETGEIEGMDGVQQRVILICSYAINPPPTFIDPKTLKLLEGRIRESIESQMGADVEVLTVKAERKIGGRLRYEVVYRNNLTGTEQTATS